MTREEFEEVPDRRWNEDIGEFDSLVIIPRDELHDSGFRCMAFVACYRDMAVYKIEGGSDVIHVDGIGGYGVRGILNFHQNREPFRFPDAWCLDCLKTSGYLRLFAGGSWGLKAGTAMSSFDVYSVSPPEQSTE